MARHAAVVLYHAGTARSACSAPHTNKCTTCPSHVQVVFVAVLAFSLGVLLFVIGVARRAPILPAFVNGFILVVVANVPEVGGRGESSAGRLGGAEGDEAA